ncbi:hypothetical protein Taro_033226 [Colocasia esculenta]|uniref:Uncharacterized protein n=1 Tax=Colocasia esculenta TaxID=4460 RepID=A0A843W458_COLES|nr:hypothetical protein [Colocasia esculenta]
MAAAVPRLRVPTLTRPRRSALPRAAAIFPPAASPRGRSGPPRRLFLGLGAALLDTVARMASSSDGGGGGGRSLTASARQRQGTSPIEQGHPRVGFHPASLSLLPQLHVPVFLKLPTGTEGWLEDRGTRGVVELREEMLWRGAIPVGARGGFGVNRGISGGVSGQWLRILASTSIDARFISWDINGQIPCRLLPISGSRCCRQHKFLKWLIEEIGVVEEMIRKKVLSA